MEDIKLMEKCLDGNLDYFGKIYDKYVNKIYRFVFLKVSNKELAEDIVSDVFISALNNISSFRLDKNSNVKSWLYRIANNKVIDFYRTNKSNEELLDYLDYSINNDAGENLDNKNKLKEVFGYLKTINSEHRDIVVYRIWEDLSYKEISEITGKSVDNCKKVVSRVLKNISANFVVLLLILILL